jgi:DNA-binding sugar fermentation-stimulating protein
MLYSILSIGAAILGAIAFQSQFWRDVNCDDEQVFTTIYNNGKISEIKNAREVAYSREDGRRTCIADAMADKRMQKLIFVIDTSRRGQTVNAPFYGQVDLAQLPKIGARYNKFSVSYQLHD